MIKYLRYKQQQNPHSQPSTAKRYKFKMADMFMFSTLRV